MIVLIFLGMILGQGAFGRVVKAEAIGIVEYVDVLSVAVKMVKGNRILIIFQSRTLVGIKQITCYSYTMGFPPVPGENPQA